MYEENKTGNPPRYSSIVDLVISCSSLLSIFVFLDALDECTDDQQRDIIDLVDQLCNSDSRVFLTSQPHLIPRVDQIGTITRCNITANEEDLDIYINRRLTVRCPDLHSEIKSTIRNNLIDGADGMYS